MMADDSRGWPSDFQMMPRRHLVGGYEPSRSTTMRLSRFTGPAATALETARAGQVVDVTAHGMIVAQIIPVAEEVQIISGMRVHGSGRNFRIPQVVARMPEGCSGADQVIADRRR